MPGDLKFSLSSSRSSLFDALLRDENLTSAQASDIVGNVRDGPAPLSFAQERLWFLDQFQPGLPVYNIPMPLRWSGPLNVAALEHALNEIVRRHEALRTTFQVVDGRPCQMVEAFHPAPLPQG